MFCPRCGTQAPEGNRFCSSCGGPIDAGTQQPQQQYQQSPQYAPPSQYPPQQYQQPYQQPYPPPSAWPSQAPARSSFALSPASIVALVALAAAFASVFMPWASVAGFDLSAMDDMARFRLGDWREQDNLDGYAVMGLAGIGLLFTLLGAAGGGFAPVARWFASTASGLLIPLAIVEIQFVMSKDGVDIGYGLYVLAGAGVVTAVAGMLPGRR